MSTRQAILLTIIIEVALGILSWMNYGFTLEAWQATTRFSGRFSLAIFSVIFLLHPYNQNRLEAYLSPHYFFIFALAHGIHLVELISFVMLSGNQLIPLRLLGGFLAYVLIFVMPVLDSRAKRSAGSARAFTFVTWVYLFYVWFVFFMSYLPRVQGKLPNVGGSYSEFVVLLSWVSMLMGIKIQQLIANRKLK